MRKVEITVEERTKRNISYEFVLPNHISENDMNIIIAKVENQANCADDVVYQLKRKIPGLEVKEIEKSELDFDDAEIMRYDIEGD
ncbi:TPA: hypothetical protein ACXPT9_004890 [Bacillus cereus]